MDRTPDVGGKPGSGKRTRRTIIALAALVAIGIALPVTYCLRLRANEKAMVEAMNSDDETRITKLVN